jgi:hypothetical protein
MPKDLDTVIEAGQLMVRCVSTRGCDMLSQSRKSLVLGIIGLAVMAGGCSRTYYRLEYDRMTGTAYPPAQTISGNTVNLGSIYGDAGYSLEVIEDDTNIQPLSGPADPADPNQYDYITEAELDTLEQAFRGAPVSPTTWSCGWWIFEGTCRRYYVYGLVVDHYYEFSSGARSTGIMGIMWTGGDRRAFSNFYKNSTIKTDGGKYLRSTAHEIGHAFNLHHQDGDGSTTIMNQTSVVGNSYVYDFSVNSQDHLDNHPSKCVRPGTGAFGSVNTIHTAHGWTTANCN